MSKVDKSGAWQQVDRLRVLLESSEDVNIARLEESWKLLTDSRATLGRDDELANLHFSPATYMAKLVQKGVYPPPEILLWLASQIDEYVEARGEKDLEVLLFGSRTRGPHGGNYAARENGAKGKFGLILKLGKIRAESPELSLRGALELATAGEVFGDVDDCTDTDSTLRNLRDRGYTNELFTHKDPDLWYSEVVGEKR